MKFTFRNYIAGFAVLIMAGCTHQVIHTIQHDTVTLPGTGDSQDLLRQVARSYMLQYPERQVMVPDSIGSGGGIKAVGTGVAPIGRVARVPSPKELATYGAFQYMEFARVPVAFVVSSNVGVPNLSEAQICAIYSGQITNWKGVGGPDLFINVQARPDAGSNMQTIRKYLPCFAELEVVPKAHFNLRNADLVQSMQTFPGSIGFMPLSEAKLHEFTVVSLDGVAPHTLQYKLGIGLGFVYQQLLSPSIQAFLNYLFTEPAHKIMVQTGHVPVLAVAQH